MPWRGLHDPYRIWVSEVMLQQTQVATVIPYYERFVARFPTLESLARAQERDVLRLWAGLGYYARARNLMKAARQIVKQGGAIPGRFDQLLRLPGFGAYTAGAVASIAFGQRVACIDGNVIRVAARLLALPGDPRMGPPRRELEAAVSGWVDPHRPGDFNQALMELGATICLPATPRCHDCPLARVCRARRDGLENAIPPPRPSRTTPAEAVVGVCRERGRVLIARRPEGKRFAGLWEFPGGKVNAGESGPEALAREFMEELGIRIAVGREIAEIKHTYTRFRITLRAYEARRVAGVPRPIASAEIRWVPVSRLGEYAFPAANQKLIALIERS